MLGQQLKCYCVHLCVFVLNKWIKLDFNTSSTILKWKHIARASVESDPTLFIASPPRVSFLSGFHKFKTCNVITQVSATFEQTVLSVFEATVSGVPLKSIVCYSSACIGRYKVEEKSAAQQYQWGLLSYC